MTLECYERLRGLKMGKYAPISRRWFPWRCPASAVGLLELFPLLSQLGELVVNQFCRKLNKRGFLVRPPVSHRGHRSLGPRDPSRTGTDVAPRPTSIPQTGASSSELGSLRNSDATQRSEGLESRGLVLQTCQMSRKHARH